MIMLTEGELFVPPLSRCTLIPTTVDDVLEGPHSFFVTISDITPDGALTVGTPSITEVTIIDLNSKSMNTTCYLTEYGNVVTKRLHVFP